MVKVVHRSKTRGRKVARKLKLNPQPLKTYVRYGLDGKPIALFAGAAKRLSIKRDAVTDDGTEDLSRRKTVQHWEFHERSKQLGLPWAVGMSGEERIKLLRKKGKLMA